MKPALTLVTGVYLVLLAVFCGGSSENTNDLIAFHSDRDGGNYDIYTMRADGKNAVRLTDYAGADRDPAWSPDGSKIVFWSRCAGPDPCWNGPLAATRPWNIVMMNTDGSGQRNLTGNRGGGRPAWSPLPHRTSSATGIRIRNTLRASRRYTQLSVTSYPNW